MKAINSTLDFYNWYVIKFDIKWGYGREGSGFCFDISVNHTKSLKRHKNSLTLTMTYPKAYKPESI